MYTYMVFTDDDFEMMETNSFCEAVKYAKENAWRVYSNEAERVVYDGAGDELIL